MRFGDPPLSPECEGAFALIHLLTWVLLEVAPLLVQRPELQKDAKTLATIPQHCQAFRGMSINFSLSTDQCPINLTVCRPTGGDDVPLSSNLSTRFPSFHREIYARQKIIYYANFREKVRFQAALFVG